MIKTDVVKKLSSWLESRDNSPFKNTERDIKVIDYKESVAFLATSEVFYEERYVSLESESTRENRPDPEVNRSNIDKWSYSIKKSRDYHTHDKIYRVRESEYVDSCSRCRGFGEINCSYCGGNGQCISCSGRGENKCTASNCAGGRCKKCAGTGDQKCSWCHNGRCSRCQGRGFVTGDIDGCSSCNGTGNHRECNGKGTKTCSKCSGNGACGECDGSGTIRCNRCWGSGNCNTCNGTGKVTCGDCSGTGKMLFYLEVTASFINEFKDCQVVDKGINTYGELNLNEYVGKSAVKNIHSKESFHFSSSEDASTSIVKNEKCRLFLNKVIGSNRHSNIHKERINYYEIPVYILKYEFQGSVYESYFFTDDLEHQFKTNPFEEYLKNQEKLIKNQISGEKYSSASFTIKKIIKSYKSLSNNDKVWEFEGKLEDNRLRIQQEIGKGGLYAQLILSLLNLFVVLFCVENGHGKTPFIFWLGLELFRHGFYWKDMAWHSYFAGVKNEWSRKFINGGDGYEYYFYNGIEPRIGMLLGIAGMIYSLFVLGGPYFTWILIIGGIISIIISGKYGVSVRKSYKEVEQNLMDSPFTRFCVLGKYHFLIESSLIIIVSLLFKKIFKDDFSSGNLGVLVGFSIFGLLLGGVAHFLTTIKGEVSEDKRASKSNNTIKKTSKKIDLKKSKEVSKIKVDKQKSEVKPIVKPSVESVKKNDNSESAKNIFYVVGGIVVLLLLSLGVYFVLGNLFNDESIYETKEKSKIESENDKTDNENNQEKVEFVSNKSDNEDVIKDDNNDSLTIIGNNIWVRSSPKTGEVIFNLNEGDVCKVLSKCCYQEIRGLYDYWYEIEFKGEKGWVYGSQTSLSNSEMKDDSTYCEDCHTVKEGESIYSISSLYDLSTDELKNLNPQIKDDWVTVGMKLRVISNKEEGSNNTYDYNNSEFLDEGMLVKGYLYTCFDYNDAQKLRDLLKKGESLVSVLEIFNQNSEVRIRAVLLDADPKDEPILFKFQNQLGVSDIVSAEDSYFFILNATEIQDRVEENVTEQKLSVGDFYQGGRIIYILKPGDKGYIEGEEHGLIIAEESITKDDKSNNCGRFFSVFNFSESKYTGGTFSEIGAGAENTKLLAKDNGEGSAALFCESLNINGYTDWFLPSIDELSLVHKNYELVGGVLPTKSQGVWSSSEVNGKYAFVCSFDGGGNKVMLPKHHGFCIKPLRNF